MSPRARDVLRRFERAELMPAPPPPRDATLEDRLDAKINTMTGDEVFLRIGALEAIAHERLRQAKLKGPVPPPSAEVLEMHAKLVAMEAAAMARAAKPHIPASERDDDSDLEDDLVAG